MHRGYFIQGMLVGITVGAATCLMLSPEMPRYKKKAVKCVNRKARKVMEDLTDKIPVCGR